MTGEDTPTWVHPAEFENNAATCFLWSDEYYEIIPRLAATISTKDQVRLFVGSQHQDREAIELLLKKHGARLENIHFTPLKGSYQNIWIRDYGPLYLINKKNRKLLRFRYFWTDPGFIGDFAGSSLLKVDTSALNSTGGAREVNGKGTLILCEQHELDVNPDVSLEEIEAEMKMQLGIRKIIWLKKGLPQDDSFLSGPLYGEVWPKGVHGHVDEFCRFADPHTILITSVSEAEAGQSPILADAKRRLDENLRILESATDQDGQSFRILKVPMAPLLITDRRQGPEGKIIASVSSYMNFIISNSLIILPSYRDKEAKVESVFREAFPQRELIRIRADTINYYSGGFHCISIHEPA